jgi:hypothetical protein
MSVSEVIGAGVTLAVLGAIMVPVAICLIAGVLKVSEVLRLFIINSETLPHEETYIWIIL